MVKHLDKGEIRALTEALRAHFLFHLNFCAKDPIGKYIQFPKVPKVLSESIVLDLIRDRILLTEEHITEANFGGQKADILAKNTLKELKIEVKSTGQKGFVEFGKKDITCNYLVWLHFDAFFQQKEDMSVEIYVLENPKVYFPEPCKPDIKTFRKCNPKIFSFMMTDFY